MANANQAIKQIAERLGRPTSFEGRTEQLFENEMYGKVRERERERWCRVNGNLNDGQKQMKEKKKVAKKRNDARSARVECERRRMKVNRAGFECDDRMKMKRQMDVEGNRISSTLPIELVEAVERRE